MKKREKINNQLHRNMIYSIGRYCSKLNVSVEELLQSYLDYSQNKIAESNKIANNNREDFDLPKPTIPENIGDYLSHLQKHLETLLSFCASLLESQPNLVDEFNIDESYFSNLYENLFEKKCDKFNNKSIGEFVRQIPIVYSFESDLTTTTFINKRLGIPVIEIDQGLEILIHKTTEISAGFTTRFEHNKKQYLSEDEIRRHKDYFEVLKFIILKIDLNKKIHMGMPIENKDEKVNIQLDKVSSAIFGFQLELGAMLFILLHEIGHILLGHFKEKTNTQKEEFEADHFATTILSRNYMDKKNLINFSPIGIQVFIFLNELFSEESSYSDVEINKYPSAIDRMQRVCNLFNKILPHEYNQFILNPDSIVLLPLIDIIDIGSTKRNKIMVKK